MEYDSYKIVEIAENAKETILLKVVPTKKEIFSFFPGQYTQIINPTFRPQEAHSFSIACSPSKKDNYLEYCIKIYGEWTRYLSKKKKGEELLIAGPFGNFIFDKTKDTNAVFLVGGVGVSPIMSILQFIQDKNIAGNFLLLYGSRTQEYIAYREELNQLEKLIDNFRVIHILSDNLPDNTWKGYTGFLTKQILEKEVDFSLQPTFFVIGPPIFIEKTRKLLSEFSVNQSKIKVENIT